MSSTSKEPAAKEKDSTAKELFQWLIAILAAVAIALFVDNFLIVNAQIPSGSMENTIMTGDRVVGNRLSYLTKDPERYDVIIFKYPDDESQLFIKRIIGLPGETVEIRDGHIYIDGSSEPLEDVETKEYMVGNYGPYTVPEGCYFVMGDNRNDSKDSRYWINPYVSKDKILGKVKIGRENCQELAAAGMGCVAGEYWHQLLPGGNKLSRAGLAMILGGGMSNYTDRRNKGYVTDYVSLNVKNKEIRKIVFNLSDVCIAAGTILWAAGNLFSYRKK